MDDDYIVRVRERLSEGRLLDAAFDCLLPPAARSKSMLHWTPVSVARLVAERLAQRGAAHVLDAGSGPGKFCTVAASTCSHLTFTGIEQRVELVSAARAIAARLNIPNAHFELGDALAHSWAPFDGFYFFNPFAENASGAEDLFDGGTDNPKRRFGTEALRLLRRLRQARDGSVVVTYHGLGGPLPSTFELAAEESSGSGCLRTWIKTRDREEPWVYLDYGAVSVLPWGALELDSSASAVGDANPARRDMPLERARAHLELGGGPDSASVLGLQSGLDDLAGERLQAIT
jgi:SAM-dependent methyltransferase